MLEVTLGSSGTSLKPVTIYPDEVLKIRGLEFYLYSLVGITALLVNPPREREGWRYSTLCINREPTSYSPTWTIILVIN